jgi:hypothetical protein
VFIAFPHCLLSYVDMLRLHAAPDPRGVLG